jgi:hypothetical protein
MTDTNLQVKEVNWAEVRAMDEAIKQSPKMVQDLLESYRESWNEHLFELARLLNPEVGYDGETSEELLEKIAEKLYPLEDLEN